MIGEVWRVAKSLVTLADDLQKYHSEIKEIRQELRDLTIIVHALAQDNKHTKEQSALVKENILLEVEKRLSALDWRLPPASKKAGKKAATKKGSKQ